MAVAAVALLLGAAVWKPWEGGRPAPGSIPAPIPTGAVGQLLPAATNGPAGTVAPARTPEPSVRFAGLDLEFMGISDPHAAWGVAVAYVPSTFFANAAARGSSVVTPVVSWELIEPGGRTAAPTLDHPRSTSVAVGATWPVGTRPVAIRLISFGPSARPSPNPAAVHRVVLGATLAARLQTASGERPGVGLTSGAFFLPSPTPSDSASDWLGHGWPAGTYGFEIDLEGGSRLTLPFRIGGSIGS